jgi:hypothetical protein
VEDQTTVVPIYDYPHRFEVIHDGDMPKPTFCQTPAILGLFDRMDRYGVSDRLD